MNLARLLFDKPEHLEFAKHLIEQGYKYLGSGTYRNTFINEKGNFLIKIPKNHEGTEDNKREARAYKNSWNKPYLTGYQSGMKLAPCRLLPNGCLLMVVVDIKVNYDDLPKWARYIDSAQVGMYKNNLVAYDYALDV